MWPSNKRYPSSSFVILRRGKAEIRQLEKEKKLTLQDYVDSEAVDEEIRVCLAELHCARVEAVASPSGPCDIHGVGGAVCNHGFAILGSFMDLWGPEQFM